jgi:hypothetical protein
MWDKLPRWIKTSNSSRGHKISTRDGSEIDSDLTYKFEKLDRSSQGVFVSKNQTKVTYPLQLRARKPASTPAIFPLAEFTTPQDYQPHPLVPSLAASTMARSRGGIDNKNLNFKLGHYSILTPVHTLCICNVLAQLHERDSSSSK